MKWQCTILLLLYLAAPMWTVRLKLMAEFVKQNGHEKVSSRKGLDVKGQGHLQKIKKAWGNIQNR